jgi:hypothetical protein
VWGATSGVYVSDLRSLRVPSSEIAPREPEPIELESRGELRRTAVPEPARAMTEVAYIGGAGRSGSTILALVLGQLPGFVAVGGLSNLWERGLQQNYLCGCGAHFRECPFWQEVGREAFGGWDRLDADEIVRLKFSVMRYRHLPWHVAPGVRSRFSARLSEYSGYMARLYAGIRTVSGCRVVVDSSHEVLPALLLRRVPNVQGHVLHLVRDSRGVTFSLSKLVLRAEATASPVFMSRYSAGRASIEWVVANLPFHLIPGRSIPRLRVRYESVLASPRTELAQIVEFLGGVVSPADASTLAGNSIDISDNHMVSGNPHRLGSGPVQLRLDDKWRSEMRSIDRAIVTALTFPLELAYGYIGRRNEPRSEEPGASA